MRRVFVDSGGFFAELAAEDPLHETAMALFRQARDENWELVTSNIVVIETYALLLHRARTGREAAVAFLDLIDAGLCHVERATAEDERNAGELVRAHEDKTYSLCDAISFVVMERLGITGAIAFDRDFKDYGRFVILEP